MRPLLETDVAVVTLQKLWRRKMKHKSGHKSKWVGGDNQREDNRDSSGLTNLVKCDQLRNLSIW